MPLHPTLKNVSRTGYVAHHLLHVRVLVPKLVDTRQNGHGFVPQIACVVNLFVLHFHLSIAQPQSRIAVLLDQRALKNAASSVQFALIIFPLSIADPIVNVLSTLTHVVLKVFSLGQSHLRQLLRISNVLLRRWRCVLNLPLIGLAKNLLCCNLHRRSMLILDTHSSVPHVYVFVCQLSLRRWVMVR